MVRINKPYRIQKVNPKSYVNRDGSESMPSGYRCRECMIEFRKGQASVFIPRTKSNTKVGIRFHVGCFEKFINEMKSITDKELESIKKKAMVMDL